MFNGTSSSNDPCLILCKCLSFNKRPPSAELSALLAPRSRLRPNLSPFFLPFSTYLEHKSGSSEGRDCFALHKCDFTTSWRQCESEKPALELRIRMESRIRFGWLLAFGFFRLSP